MTPIGRIWKIIGGGPSIAFGYALADMRDAGLSCEDERLLWRHCAGMLTMGAIIPFGEPADIVLGGRVARYQFVEWDAYDALRTPN